jgi:ceramide glucosyltransferase
MSSLATALLGASAVGLALLFAQHLTVWIATRRPIAAPRSRPPVSVLKPLCGVDDGLEENLLAFACLEYPSYEVLLGIENPRDPAFAVAQAAAVRWPDRFRVVLQQRRLGLNPKVNQLVGLERAARHDILVVSDSNTTVRPEALDELAALFDDPKVACVSSPVSGTGHRTLGALLDNLHLAASVGAGQLAAKALFGRNLVVGKLMALRRSALSELGGFEAYANVLAEDYAIGADVVSKLGLEVAIGRRPVLNVAVNRSVKSFFLRYMRWAVIHRTAVSLPVSLTQGLLNPWPLSLLALLSDPSGTTLWGAAGTLASKTVLDVATARHLGCRRLGYRAPLAVALKDVLLFAAWTNGFFSRTIDWRGHRLRVTQGSRLVDLPVPQPLPS